ncbi:unnamed protein product [Rotaria magnacalcarata]|uniref:Uncharacterized protein n=1 Tax=Rotaria magnacalcarata TaxID=392030 RepID=A0A816QT19_9BILA|nr:unnamed protein product [Rotaria magnacalcarata]CAF3906503.1 unnamed protein product [Rotaria magnacalcarata]
MVCPVELKQLVIDNLKDITFIEACKLYIRASTSGRTCDCKGKCASKQCPYEGKMIQAFIVYRNSEKNEIISPIQLDLFTYIAHLKESDVISRMSTRCLTKVRLNACHIVLKTRSNAYHITLR